MKSVCRSLQSKQTLRAEYNNMGLPGHTATNGQAAGHIRQSMGEQTQSKLPGENAND